MASASTRTIVKYRRGRTSEAAGTLEELKKYFGYTLEAGSSWNSSINTDPETFKGLVSALNKSVDELQSGSFAPDFYELKDNRPQEVAVSAFLLLILVLTLGKLFSFYVSQDL